jgi:polyribonucleotide 5'-hydroxyl-kinase
MSTISDDGLPPPVGERHVLQPREELRLEIGFTSASSGGCSIVVQKGSCELFGCELASVSTNSGPGSTSTSLDSAAISKARYIIPGGGIKIALFTWHGCVIDVEADELEISYISDETAANVAFVNTHAQLEALRDDAAATISSTTNGPNPSLSLGQGPRVLVCGPKECGKSSLCKTLVAYACKVGRTPLWVDLDPMDNSISVPGSLAVAPMINSAVTVETYATTGLPINTTALGGNNAQNVHPLVFFHGSTQTIHTDLFKAQVDSIASSIDSRLQNDPLARSSGIIVNTNGWVQDEGYDLLLHVCKSLKISVVLILGHDRLYSMMTNHFRKLEKEKDDRATDGMMIDDDSPSSVDDVIIPKVLKLPRSGGVVSRPSNFIRQCRSRAVKRYFYGGMTYAANKSKDDSKDLTMGTTSSLPSIKSVVNHMAPQLTPHLKQISLLTNPTGDSQDDKVRVYKLSTMALSSSLLPVAQQQTTDAIQLEEVDVDAATSTTGMVKTDDSGGGGSDGNDEGSDSLQHALVAVCHPSAVAAYQSSGRGRDLVTSGVAGFGAVESVVSGQSIDLLSPCAGSLPSKTFILGDITWME